MTTNIVTFGKLKYGDLFTLDNEENIVFMKINDEAYSEASNAVNLITGNPVYFCAANPIIPLIGKLEVTKI